jgi:hypothetical protein
MLREVPEMSLSMLGAVPETSPTLPGIPSEMETMLHDGRHDRATIAS